MVKIGKSDVMYGLYEVDEMDETDRIIKKTYERMLEILSDKENLVEYYLSEMRTLDYKMEMNLVKEEEYKEYRGEMVEDMLEKQVDETLIKTVTKISDEDFNRLKTELLD